MSKLMWVKGLLPIVAHRGIVIPLLCSYRGGSKSQESSCKQACIGFPAFWPWCHIL